VGLKLSRGRSGNESAGQDSSQEPEPDGVGRTYGDSPSSGNGGRSARRFAIGFFVAIFVLLGGLYAAGYAFTSERVPREVSVSGVDIGGLTPADAREKLRKKLLPRADEPIVVRDEAETYRVDASEAGLSLDAAATVEAAGGGRSLSPLRMVEVLTGGDDVDPVLVVDEDALDKAVRKLAKKVQQRPVEGAITFAGGRAEPVYPTPGRSLDQEAMAADLEDAFLDEDADVSLPVSQMGTELKDKDVDTAMTRFAEPAMSGPVTVKAAGRSAKIFPAQLGKALSMRARDGRLVPLLDPEVLEERASRAIRKLGDQARPATVALRGGSPQVVPGESGHGVDVGRLAKGIVGVLTRTGERRTVTVGLQRVEPAFGTADARKLGIKEVVSRFTTEFPHSSYRNTNLGRAAEKINGTVLKPGEVFSLNDVVGERTAANGFTRGYVISDGVLVEDFGGGVSQVATTTYNAAFFAGMKDVEHEPHSLYFDRYPMGREATVVWGALDLKFQNTTPHGVLVQAWIEPSTPSSYGKMHVRMWSTKYWEIKAGLSDQYDFTEPQVRYDTSDKCVEQTGFSGFEVDVYRYFHRDGERVKTEKQHVKYDAGDTVHCRARPKPEGDSTEGSAETGSGEAGAGSESRQAG
jgi:vancomycin resistance protein YoaR